MEPEEAKVKKRAEDQTKFSDMYVYQSNVTRDLIECVMEYVGECEHASEIANCPEVSSYVIEDVKLWNELRKEKLIRDFIEYWDSAYGISDMKE